MTVIALYFSLSQAIVIVVTVAFVQEYKSEQALEQLGKLVSLPCNVSVRCMRDTHDRFLTAATSFAARGQTSSWLQTSVRRLKKHVHVLKSAMFLCFCSFLSVL